MGRHNVAIGGSRTNKFGKLSKAEREARFELVIKLREENNFTFRQIGEEMQPPVKAQRAVQIYAMAVRIRLSRNVREARAAGIPFIDPFANAGRSVVTSMEGRPFPDYPSPLEDLDLED